VKTTREVLEAALEADFGDLVTHQAYADLLTEEGDPRAELVRVQLALEDKTPSWRPPLRACEEELFAKHGASWLGGLAPYRVEIRGPGGARPNCCFGMARGWVRSVSILRLERPLLRAFCECPLARLLHWLSIPHRNQGVTWGDLYKALAKAPFLGALQTLELADRHDLLPWHNEEVVALVGRMPRLERLILAMRGQTTGLFALPMPHLNSLHIQGARQFALDVLANNSGLANLERLDLEPTNPLKAGQRSPLTLEGLRALCRSPHLRKLNELRLRRTEFGADGLRELIASGLFARLHTLDLHGGAITDEGARLLAAQPGVAEMEVSLRDNALTEAGVVLVEGAGEDIYASRQHEPDSTDYLYEFDLE
jgi:uncharacterized protein (TIGR02996 family)